MTLRIGSLFSGYGGLDMGVQAVLGGEIAWHCQYDPEDRFQYAARILAHHWPEVPNLGDITRVKWQRVLDEHGPVDVITGGFPCTDLSSAGQRLGLMIGTRSGLWHYMLEGIAALQPRLVVIENVRGILSTKARSGVEPDACCVDYAGGKPVLRALGAVLGDLATIGFDAEWAGVRASEVGAPHERFREFIIAWPAAADAANLGHERGGQARRGWAGPAYGDLTPADADRLGCEGQRSDAGQAPQRPAPATVGCGPAGSGGVAADTASIGRREGRAEPTGQFGRSDAAERGGAAAADPGSGGRGPIEFDVREGQPDVDWGDYAPAIRRWETILGRRHPWPTNDRGQLAAEFDEWMMGLPEGHLCSVPPAPGMTEANLRNARIKAAGNGVVPLQSAAATRLLLDRVAPEVPIVRQLVEYAAHDARRVA